MTGLRLKSAADNRVDRGFGLTRPYIALEYVESGTGRLIDAQQLLDRDADDCVLYEPGDVLFGKLRPYLAKVVMPDWSGCASGEFLVLRPRPGVYSRYLYYQALSQPFLDWAEATSYGTKMPRTSWEAMSEFRFSLPPLDKQRAIADFLDRETVRLDRLVERQQEATTLLRERLNAEMSARTMSAAVIEGTRTPSVHDSNGWRRLHLRRCFASVDYGIGTAVERDGAFPVLGMGNVQDREVVGEPIGFVDDVDPSLLLEAGDLLFSRTNSLSHVGKVALYRGNHVPTTFASYVVRLRTNELADPEFLNYLLNTREVLTLARTMAFPSIHQANLNPNRYCELSVWLPPFQQQREIVGILDRLVQNHESLTLMLKRQTDLLRERRQALITAAATGQVEVPT